jgi:mRNA interferase MazF
MPKEFVQHSSAQVAPPPNHTAEAAADLVWLSLCPITSQIKNYPFEVPLPIGSKIRGAILAGQLKSLDWRQRRAEKLARLPMTILDQVRERVAILIGFT